MNSPPRDVLEALDLCRAYEGASGPELRILRGVNLTLQQGEAVAIVGDSGSGKSTLLHLLGALDQPTSGTVRLDGADIGALDDEQAAAVRNRQIGFVFQFHHLLQDFTALENVMMPALIRGRSAAAAGKRATALLRQVGLGDRLGHQPGELSGGEQQRVAVARALVNRPLVILADEPTGNLDARTSGQVQDVLFELKRQFGVALLLVTHNRHLAARAERVMRLDEGVLHDV